MADIFTEFVNWGIAFANSWGYLGIFIISLIGNASIFLPVPSYLIVVAAGSIMNPWLLGVFGGMGAAIGELSGYALGRGSGYVIQRKYKSLLKKTRAWSERHGLFPLIVLFAATPLPDDIVGIIAGIINYSIKRFMLANIIGKIIAYTALGWMGYFGSELLGNWSMLLIFIFSLILFGVIYKFIKAETVPVKPKPKRNPKSNEKKAAKKAGKRK